MIVHEVFFFPLYWFLGVQHFVSVLSILWLSWHWRIPGQNKVKTRIMRCTFCLNYRKTLIRDSLKRYLGKPQVPRNIGKYLSLGATGLRRFFLRPFFFVGKAHQKCWDGASHKWFSGFFCCKRDNQDGQPVRFFFRKEHHILLLKSFIQVQTETFQDCSESRKNDVNIQDIT